MTVFTFDRATTDNYTFVPDPSEQGVSDGYLKLILNSNNGTVVLNHSINAERLDPRYSPQSKVPYKVTIIVNNLNDVYPHFENSPYYKEVNELTPITTTVFILKGRAEDDDSGGSVTNYAIAGGSDGKFKLIGPTSDGMVAVAETLDYDRGKRIYNINISVTDNEFYGKKLTSYGLLIINVTDGDDQNPKFSNEAYTLSIPEQTPSIVNQPLLTVPPLHAFDQDTGINMTINYSIEKGTIINNEVHFRMDNQTGALYLLKSLDRENLIPNPFTIQVKAYQIDRPEARSTLTDVTVTVTDINDNPPVMSLSPYLATIPENSAVGTTVLQVAASDKDLGLNAEFDFDLVDPSSTFSINSTTGIVTVLNSTKLDRELNSFVQAKVFAVETQTAEKLKSVPSDLIVTLSDANDNKPVFYPSEVYNFRTNETVTLNSKIGQVWANDSDLGLNGEVVYSIIYATNDGLNKFQIDSAAGVITNKALLSSPYFDKYRLTVQATDKAASLFQRRSSTAAVTIDVTDINNNAPVFNNAPYSTKIGELIPPRSIVFQISATDADKTSVLSYSITAGDLNKQFSISSMGMVKTAKSLDREVKPSYNLTIEVTDGKYKALTSLGIELIDVNDNAPVFGNNTYQFNVTEEQPIGALIGVVKATDADVGGNGEITYSFVGTWAKDFFSINAIDGQITSTKKLDLEARSVYEFSVQAIDNGNPRLSSSASVSVFLLDINDNLPVFVGLPYAVTIPENLLASKFFTPQISDKDIGINMAVRFSITSGDMNLFTIDTSSGSLSLKSPISLAAGKPTQYTVTMMVYNTEPPVGAALNQPNNTADVVIKIQDVNDNAPLFTKPIYEFPVYENETLGKLVGKVLALDADSTNKHEVKYWISGGDGRNQFQIDQTSGEIKLWQPIDRDSPNNNTAFVLQVSASDFVPLQNGTVINSTATVKITVLDVNDNKPKFGKSVYSVNVSELAAPGTVISTDIRATDIDEGNSAIVQYYLQTSNVPFSVQQTTGDLSVSGKLDFDEGIKKYELVVLGIDQGSPSQTGSTSVIVNIENKNDNAPIFIGTPFEFKLNEQLPPGTLIGRTQATDLDGDKLTYAVDSSVKDMITVNDAGELRTLMSLDYEKNTTLTFAVSTTDGTTIVNSPVKIDVQDINDNPPRFQKAEFKANVSEDSANKVIIQVTATDSDSGINAVLRYIIISGNQDGIFSINSSNGEISVVKGSALNFNVKPLHYLIIQAKDGGDPTLSAFCTVKIQVLDINNNAPVFKPESYTASISENLPKDSPVTQVTATDKDTVDSVSYRLLNLNSLFSVNSKTGEVVTQRPLNREQTDSYGLNISACDAKYCDYTTVRVTVLDVNDNPPVFNRTHYKAYVQQNAKLGRLVTRVVATDDDIDNNKELTYWITRTDGKFSIGYNTGEVRLAGAVDRSVKSVYDMRVYVEDHGRPSLTMFVPLTVYINNTNARGPRFSSFGYTTAIPENATANSLLLTINATDEDEGSAGEFTLSITGGNVDDTFRLTSNGDLFLNKPLDYENIRYYELNVTARDKGEEPLSSVTTVRITVLDINDESPRFEDHPSVLRVLQTTPRDSVIYTFTANDKDSYHDGNNLVNYSLETGAPQFAVNNTGTLYVNTDALAVQTYTVLIRAHDRGKPSRTSQPARVQVEVVGDFSLYPIFSTTQYYKRLVNESTAPPVELLDIDAWIGGVNNGLKDSGINYSLTGDGSTDFTLNQNTGILTMVKQPDRERRHYYLMIATATNIKDTRYSTQAGISIQVADTSDSPPKFPFHLYDVTVPENAKIGDQVIAIEAIDTDHNPKLTYSKISGDSGELFRVTTSNNHCIVEVNKRLDRDQLNSNHSGIFTLEVSVNDGKYTAKTVVRILVEDVNDNAPVFTESQYTKTVPENIGAGFEIIQVKATDADKVDKNKIRYKIIQGNDAGSFEISKTTGMISRSNTISLDREAKSSYELTILAEDSGNNNATATVIISLSDINDEKPTFKNLPYNATTKEGTDSLSLVITVSATDADAVGNNSKIVYSITEGNKDQEFKIQTVNSQGVISVVKMLDREKPGVELRNGRAIYKLKIEAKDNGIPQLSASATVTVYVKDINDQPPKFDKQQYVKSVSEGSPIGFIITTVSATDPDLALNTQLTYTIEPRSNTDNMFAINNVTGEIKLIGNLDISKQSFYNLQLVVTDSMHKATAQMRIQVVDVNNNDPVFTKQVYRYSVAENDASQQTGQFVGTVTATDRDSGLNGQINYSITSRNALGLFAIDDTGNITTNATLDREKQDRYLIIVTATDKGKPSRRGTSEVEISLTDVNDNAPVFTANSYTGTVPEHSVLGTTVIVKPVIGVTDADDGLNKAIRYSLSGVDSSSFTIDATTGTVTVATTDKTKLDLEVQEFYNIQVIAMDRNGTSGFLSSSANLRIQLTDINDQFPIFKRTSYQFNISENSPSNSFVGEVSATDKDRGSNAVIQYSILSGHDGKFYIDRLSGKLYVTGGLDRETKPAYDLNISAQDRGVNPSSLEQFVGVRINLLDYNDNPPVFKQSVITVTIPEEESPPLFVTNVNATDPDSGENSRITYSMNDSVPFSINQQGNITTNKKLDRETTAQYIFRIYATDHGSPQQSSVAVVTVKLSDINDHIPKFLDPVYYVSILEKSPVNSVILWPQVTDLDTGNNARITYSLSGAGSDLFSMDTNTGLIRIKRVIDRSKLIQQNLIGRPVQISANATDNSTLRLTLSATDHGLPAALTGNATLFVKVDEISDDTPVFTNTTYHVRIPEELPKGTHVTTVTARTKDKTISLQYTLTQPNQYFQLDPNSGNITTTGKRLNREIQDVYSFTVRVGTANRIPERASFSVVTVTLTDINDHAPVFQLSSYEFTIKEGATIDKAIGVVHATDSDAGKNAEILYSFVTPNIAGIFSINSTTGNIVSLVNLDYEQKTKYDLIVMGKDSGSPARNSTVSVTISIIDINDNSPVFYGIPYTATVQENGNPGILVATVLANDTDSELNGLIGYELKNFLSSFFIQRKDGSALVKTLGPLDYETHPTYDIKVAAYDLGTPQKTTIASIIVTVINMNDNMPRFLQRLFELSVRDDTPIGGSVGTPIPAGLGNYTYNVSGGDGVDVFAVHPNGQIYLLKQLDSRKKNLYEIEVTASDFHQPPAFDTTKVKISIIDSSPIPKFTQASYTAVYNENVAPPHVVIDLNSTDEILARPVVYTIVTGGEAGLFTVNSSNGMLICHRALDRESVSKYEIIVAVERVNNTVQPTGRKRRALKANEAIVTINVGDKNDNPPIFNDITVGVPADASYNYLVTTLKATDRDTGINAVIHYKITGGPNKADFLVEEKTGKVLSRVDFSYLTATTLQFTAKATDDAGKGLSDTAQVKVYKLTVNQRAILIANVDKATFQSNQNDIVGNLSKILGFNVMPLKVEPHIEKAQKKVDPSRSDMYFYAINPADGRVVDKEYLLEAIKLKQKEIDAFFKRYNLAGVKAIPVLNSEYRIGSEIGLLLLAIIIIIGCILGIIIVFISWRKREQARRRLSIFATPMSKKNPEHHHRGSSSTGSGLYLTNPLYAESNIEEETGEPLPIDEDGNPVIIVNSDTDITTSDIETLRSAAAATSINRNGHAPVFSDIPESFEQKLVLPSIIISKTADNDWPTIARKMGVTEETIDTLLSSDYDSCLLLDTITEWDMRRLGLVKSQRKIIRGVVQKLRANNGKTKMAAAMAKYRQRDVMIGPLPVLSGPNKTSMSRAKNSLNPVARSSDSEKRRRDFKCPPLVLCCICRREQRSEKSDTVATVTSPVESASGYFEPEPDYDEDNSVSYARNKLLAKRQSFETQEIRMDLEHDYYETSTDPAPLSTTPPMYAIAKAKIPKDKKRSKVAFKDDTGRRPEHPVQTRAEAQGVVEDYTYENPSFTDNSGLITAGCSGTPKTQSAPPIPPVDYDNSVSDSPLNSSQGLGGCSTDHRPPPSPNHMPNSQSIFQPAIIHSSTTGINIELDEGITHL
ncbi:cadherin-23-like [Tubulanus polymorphus]|uniref:cadherin-23-like n=1 Tax=Tubulanus polymorphus TaxID=672921 RepID=UPI003DA2099D